MDKNKVLPAGWAEAKLGEICSIKTGDKDVNEGSLNGEYPFFTCSKDIYRFATYSFDGKAILVAGNGNFNIKKYCGKFEAYQRTYVLQNFSADYDYLYYYLSGNLDELTKDNRGSTVRYIRIGNLTEFNVRIPPINEQYHIVERLEELFSELDAGVKALKTAQEQLKVYRQAVLKDAFEGKLIKKDDGLEWKWTTLGTFAENIRIGPFGTLLHESDYVANGTPIINPKHIKNQKILHDCMVTVSTEKLKELSSYILKENDIILGRRGEMGRTAYITEREDGWICGTGSMIIRLKNGNLAKVYSLLLSEKRVINYLKNNCTGTTMSNLNEKIVKSIPIPIIPFDEQKIIFDEIETRFSLCDNFEETIEQSLVKAEALRQSILQLAFAGRLVAQDPNDEPAYKLLERIRLARENNKVEKESAKGRTKK